MKSERWRDEDLQAEPMPWLTPISFEAPQFVEESAWLEHAPFALWLVDRVRPATLVELGTHRGFSFFAFCQAVARVRSPTRCYAVDTWEGDEHAGFYGPDVLEAVKRYNSLHYAEFARLVRSTFADAASHFDEGTVDLLHIDGRHFYNDVKEDFEIWKPKLSRSAIVLLHDINVRERGFGVHRFWAELTELYPSFSFYHGHGLGVLAVGSEIPAGVEELFDGWNAQSVRASYSRLGTAITAHDSLARTQQQLRKIRDDASEEARRLRNEARARQQGLEAAVTARDAALDEAVTARDAALEEAANLRKRLEDLRRRQAEAEEAAAATEAAFAERLEDERRKHAASERRILEARRELERQLRTIHRSTSWRITRPVRMMGAARRLITSLDRRHLRLAGSMARQGQFRALLSAAGDHRAPGKAGAELEAGEAIPQPLSLAAIRSKRANGELLAADALAAEALATTTQPTFALVNEAAELAMVQGHWSTAVERWQRALGLPDLELRRRQAARTRLALAARRAGNFRLGESVAEAGLEDAPNHIELLHEHAEIAMDRADWAIALDRWATYQRAGGRAAVATAGAVACRRLLQPQELQAHVREYQRRRAEARQHSTAPTIAVVTAIIGGYDPLHLPTHLDPNVDYVVFSDRELDDLGVFDVRRLAYHATDPTRAARYVKTHLHHLLPDVDVAIWVDSNVLPLGSYSDFAQSVLSSGAPLGAISHPLRTSVFEEAAACLARGKDDADTIRRQVARYRDDGLGAHDLIESNLLVFDLRDDRLCSLFVTWWSEIERGSRRDQLGLAFALARHQVPWQPLMARPISLRDHPGFVLLDHGSWHTVALATSARLKTDRRKPELSPSFDAVKAERIAAIADVTVDIIVCVHNAPVEAQRCLEALAATRRPNVHRLIVVDDGSDEPTARLLRDHVRTTPNAMLHRNNEATGYTRAANRGLALSEAEVVILLNSDTVPTSDWVDKLVDALWSTPGAGIAGPLSNAASHQSIPNHLSSASQTAVNELPPGFDAEAMNSLCERWSAPTFPVVPLVHGFCYAITRTVLDVVGEFNENAFPDGYGEENDYCFRATDAGFALVIATNTFVFHEKSRSYDVARRISLMRRGGQTLRELHDRERIGRAVAAMQSHPDLAHARRRAWQLSARPLPHDRPLTVAAHVHAPAGYPTSSAYIRLQLPAGQEAASSRLSLELLYDGQQGECQPRSRPHLTIVQRTALASREAAEEVIARTRSAGARLIVDIDDALGLVATEADRSAGGRERHSVLEYLVSYADAVWCSTPATAGHYRHLNSDQHLLPNTIDSALWGDPLAHPPWNPAIPLRLLFAGTFTHAGGLDLVLPALERLAAERPGSFELTIIGVAKTLPSHPWLRRATIPKGRNRYPEYVRWLRDSGPFDVGIAPLRVHPFDFAKSDLKFLDYTALGLLTVASTVGAFVPHAEAGRLLGAGEGTEGWYERLSDVLSDPTLGRTIVGRAREYVSSERTASVASRLMLAAIDEVARRRDR